MKDEDETEGWKRMREKAENRAQGIKATKVMYVDTS